MLVWISEAIPPEPPSLARKSGERRWRSGDGDRPPGEPERASSCRGITALLQPVHVQITPRRPPRAGDMPQPGGREVEGALPVRKCTHARVRRLRRQCSLGKAK